MKKIIPIILSSDNNYAKYLDVTLVSILVNAKKDTFYDVYLLIAPDFSQESKAKILNDAKKYKNNKINFIEMNETFSNLKKMVSHISNPTYYRLKAAKLLPDSYDKCLYFDTDVIVNIDLQEYYNIDIEDNLFAGVKAAYMYLLPEQFTKQHCELLEIPDAKNYINAGVVIINLKQIREENLTEVFTEVAQNNYPTVDQDVINKVCYGRIKLLPVEYNVMTKYDFLNSTDDLLKVYPKDELDRAIKNPKIIHYADRIKPWQKLSSRFAKQWWFYAIKSGFLYDIISVQKITNIKSFWNESLKKIKLSRLIIFLN